MTFARLSAGDLWGHNAAGPHLELGRAVERQHAGGGRLHHLQPVRAVAARQRGAPLPHPQHGQLSRRFKRQQFSCWVRTASNWWILIFNEYISFIWFLCPVFLISVHICEFLWCKTNDKLKLYIFITSFILFCNCTFRLDNYGTALAEGFFDSSGGGGGGGGRQ